MEKPLLTKLALTQSVVDKDESKVKSVLVKMAGLVISVWRPLSKVKCVIYILYQGVESSAAALCLYA